MRAALSCALAALGALPACTTYERVPLDPSAILAELRELRVELPGDGLTPGRAVALALVHNPELRVWRRDHEIAAGLVISASAWENPELRISLDSLYSRVSAPFAYALDLRFFPPLPGELDAQRERSLAAERRVLAEIEDHEARIAGDVRAAHARLVFIDSQIVTLGAASRLHERIGEIVEQRVAAGMTTRLDATLVDLQREELSDELASLAGRRSRAQVELATLLGAAPTAPITVRAAPPETSLPTLIQTVLEDEALARRPDLRALAEVYEEREQQLHLSHLAQIPWPRHVQAGFSGMPRSTSFDLDLALEIPIGGAPDAELSVAVSLRDRARDAYRARLHVVRREIRLAVLDLMEQERRRIHHTERLTPVLRQAEELVRAALDGGATDVLAVLAIESRVLDARRSAAESARDYELARIGLAAATGRIHELP